VRVFWVYLPLVAAAFLGNLDAPLKTWAICLSSGLALWTVVEYLMHRYVLHRLAPHYQHHEEPDTLAYIFAPLWLSGVSAIVLWALLSLAAGSLRHGALVMAGTVIGYLAYEALHVRMHSPIAGGPILRALRRHHFYHHFADDNRCYGVTSPVWDVVFRTNIPYHGPTELRGSADVDLYAAGKGPHRG
jgi:sterol desaturase/sphingolipid hydroxylase (fatty acid hydroxylase superfamily)